MRGPPPPLADEDLDLLLSIRGFETTLLELFSEGQLHGTVHTCIGQEHVPVSLCPLLSDIDYIFSNHRGHGHYLARTGDFEGLLAEIMGREGGVCRGVGGSQHVRRPHYLSSGILGELFPVAVGVALHFRRCRQRGASVVFTGEGAWGEGVVYEALNMASLWRLPLIVVVENNGIAQSTPSRLQMAGSIEGRARGFGLDYLRMETRDVEEIRRHAGPAIRRARETYAPLVIEFETVRLGPHSKGDDPRTTEEIDRMRAKDWYTYYRAALGERFHEAEIRTRERLREILDRVRARPLAAWAPHAPAAD